MKKLKNKLVIAATIVTVCFAFVGCGKKDDDGVVKESGNAVKDVTDGVGDGVKDVTDGVGDGVKDITDGVDDDMKDIKK